MSSMNSASTLTGPFQYQQTGSFQNQPLPIYKTRKCGVATIVQDSNLETGIRKARVEAIEKQWLGHEPWCAPYYNPKLLNVQDFLQKLCMNGLHHSLYQHQWYPQRIGQMNILYKKPSSNRGPCCMMKSSSWQLGHMCEAMHAGKVSPISLARCIVNGYNLTIIKN